MPVERRPGETAPRSLPSSHPVHGNQGANGKVDHPDNIRSLPLPMSWSTTDEEMVDRPGSTVYSVETFYTASTQGKGSDRTTLRANVDAGQMRYMSSIVQRQIVPAYQTVQDIVRDAVAHRLWWLSHHYDVPGLKQVVSIYINAAKMRTLEIELESQRDYVDSAERTLASTRRMKDRRAYDNALEVARETLELGDYLFDSVRRDLAELVARSEQEAW